MNYINRFLKMFLIGELNDLQWSFSIEKRIQLVKTVRLSTHTDIFEEKNFSKIFFERGSKKVKIFFSINYVKFAEKFNYEIKIDKKWCFDGFLTIFSIKVPFWGPYRPSKKFSYAPLNLSHQDASFKYPYDYIWSDKFLIKNGKIGRNPKMLSKSS